jgi:hypothetical protein
LKVIGGGADGAVEVTPHNLDFGTITVGFSKTLSVVLENKSSSNMFIEFKMAEKSKD